MGSVSFGDSDDDFVSKRRRRLNGYGIVYSRRNGKKVKTALDVYSAAACLTSAAENSALVNSSAEETAALLSVAATKAVSSYQGKNIFLKVEDNDGVDADRMVGKDASHSLELMPESGDGIIKTEGLNPSNLRVDSFPGDTLLESLSKRHDLSGDPLAVSNFGDMISFSLGKRSSNDEIKDISQKLEYELESVKKEIRQLEAMEAQLASCSQNLPENWNAVSSKTPNTVAQGLSHAMLDRRSIDIRAYNRPPRILVTNTNRGPGEFVEKEKQTPKANQLYANSMFLLGKEKSNKMLKASNGRNFSGGTEHVSFFGFVSDKARNKVFRNCNSLLQRLMKHKYGWVFNEPVDAKELGLDDYHDIIKHPMDLGTIKSRLSQNWYKLPSEFAEDVRLVFHNAMTYNPKGQDVHIMAEELSQIFEEKWSVVETEFHSYLKHQLQKDGRRHAAASRKAPAQSYLKPETRNWTLDRYGPLSLSGTQTGRPYFGRALVPKKLKAKDSNKRDMTFEEKQKLGKKLHDLPGEKLDDVLEIIRKRNTAHSQHDDEIEVDIDSVDPETLWDLYRFASSYKKSLRKSKRKAQQSLLPSSTPAVVGVQAESGTFEKSVNLAGGDKVGAQNESSSSTSTSGSGSSSRDSNSGSSSGDESDAGRSRGM